MSTPCARIRWWRRGRTLERSTVPRLRPRSAVAHAARRRPPDRSGACIRRTLVRRLPLRNHCARAGCDLLGPRLSGNVFPRCARDRLASGSIGPTASRRTRRIGVGSRILEVGCSSGDLLSLMRERGAAVYGVEPSKPGRAACVARGLPVVADVVSSRPRGRSIASHPILTSSRTRLSRSIRAKVERSPLFHRLLRHRRAERGEPRRAATCQAGAG